MKINNTERGAGFGAGTNFFCGIEVITGSMFSGKTEELMRRLRRACFARQNVMLFKPVLDTRYSETDVVSHDQNRLSAIPVSCSADIEMLAQDAHVVGIDEAQFFDEGIVELCERLVDKGKRVVVAGLDMDYMGKAFGSMPQLMAIADYVDKVHAICVRCGALAKHSYRKIGGKELVELGETDRYEPLCRRCYCEAQI